jgi:hypothetical protein
MYIDWKFWPISRIFKGTLTIAFFALSFVEKDWFFIAPALFFGIQAVFNTGCGCHSQGCEVSGTSKADSVNDK